MLSNDLTFIPRSTTIGPVAQELKFGERGHPDTHRQHVDRKNHFLFPLKERDYIKSNRILKPGSDTNRKQRISIVIMKTTYSFILFSHTTEINCLPQRFLDICSSFIIYRLEHSPILSSHKISVYCFRLSIMSVGHT
jgi:hypothetical protein